MAEPTPKHMPGKEVAAEGLRWTLSRPERPIEGHVNADVRVIGDDLPGKTLVMPVSEHEALLAVQEARAEKAEADAELHLRKFNVAQENAERSEKEQEREARLKEQAEEAAVTERDRAERFEGQLRELASLRERIQRLPKEEGIADGFLRRSTVLAALTQPAVSEVPGEQDALNAFGEIASRIGRIRVYLNPGVGMQEVDVGRALEDADEAAKYCDEVRAALRTLHRVPENSGGVEEEIPDGHNLPEWLEIYAEWMESGRPIEDTNRQLMAITLRAAQRVVKKAPPFAPTQTQLSDEDRERLEQIAFFCDFMAEVAREQEEPRAAEKREQFAAFLRKLASQQQPEEDPDPNFGKPTGKRCDSCDREEKVGDEGWEGCNGLDWCPDCWEEDPGQQHGEVEEPCQCDPDVGPFAKDCLAKGCREARR